MSMFAKTAAVVMFLLAAADAEWVKQVEAWRAKHEADYTRDYVPLAGLGFLAWLIRGVNEPSIQRGSLIACAMGFRSG